MIGSLIGDLEKDERRRQSGGGGGGGRPRIRFGRTGPRGRMYSVSSGSRMRSSVVKGAYVRTGKDAFRHIGAHIKYIQEREKGELEKDKERDFFDRKRDGIERDEVEHEMKENRGEKVAMHKLILSPGDNKVDLRDYTRESMEALEQRLGHKLNWYAIEHRNTDNFHAHVVIAGKIPERELERFSPEMQERELEAERLYGKQRELDSSRKKEEARLERLLDSFDRGTALKEAALDRGDVYLDKWDYKELRDAGNAYRIQERSFDEAMDRAYEREFGREPEQDRMKDRDKERELDLEQGSWSDIRESVEKDQERREEKDRSRQAAEYQARTGFAGEQEMDQDRAHDPFTTFETDRQVRSQEDSLEERGRDEDRDLDRGLER